MMPHDITDVTPCTGLHIKLTKPFMYMYVFFLTFITQYRLYTKRLTVYFSMCSEIFPTTVDNVYKITVKHYRKLNV